MPFSCSLLIPCHNAARFLPALFAGIRAQRQTFSEILLWDDGSSDGSAEVAERLGATVIRSPNSVGPATARNELVKRARHDWVHLHDADDLILPEFLSTLAPHTESGADVIACDADWIDEQSGKVIIAWRYDHAEYAAAPAAYLLTHPLGINNCLYRRSAFLATAGYHPDLVPWEDTDFHIRLAFAGCRFQFVPQVLTQSVRHAAGISMDLRRNWNARLRCLQQYVTLIPPCIAPVLTAEAERAATELASLRDPGAAVAIRLCRELGGDPPTTSHPGLRLLKLFVPAASLLRWRHHRRLHAQGDPSVSS